MIEAAEEITVRETAICIVRREDLIAMKTMTEGGQTGLPTPGAEPLTSERMMCIVVSARLDATTARIQSRHGRLHVKGSESIQNNRALFFPLARS